MAALRGIGRRPTLWVELGVLAAWIALLFGAALARGAGGASGAGWAGGPLWICTTDLGANGGAGGHGGAGGVAAAGPLLAGFPMWGLMAVAMMVPVAMPAVRHVSGKSLFWRRRRAAAEFLLVFLLLWVGFSVLVLETLSAWNPASSPYAPAAALGLAALWQLTPLKLRAMRACHRSRPLPPRGWRASAGVADFAVHNGTACVASCWAMMLAAVVAGPGSLLWMGGMTGVMTAEKLTFKPQRTSRRVAALLAAAALIALLMTFA